MRLLNGPLTGRSGLELTINTEEGSSAPVTVASIIETAVYYKAANAAQEDTATLNGMRKLNKILDVVEEGGCCMDLKDAHYSMIKPEIESIVARSWPIHAPHVIDQLESNELSTTGCDCSNSVD